MPKNDSYFDITIKHKYDSATTEGKERVKVLIASLLAIVLLCGTLMTFSNVSSISEAYTIEDVNGKTEKFPISNEEAKLISPPAIIVNESTTSEVESKETMEPKPTPQKSEKSMEVSVTRKSSKIEIKETVNKDSNSKKETKKVSTKKKKKSSTKRKARKSKPVFKNLSTKKQKAKAVWVQLKSEGYTDAAAAGVLGNIEQESNFNENSNRSGGSQYKGLFQLSINDRFQNCINWCRSNGYDPWSVEGQTKFMLEEMNHKTVRSYQFKKFTGYDKEDYKSIDCPKEAASAWVAGYEGAIESGYGLSATWQQESKRRNYAMKWYKEFKDL